MSSRSSLWAVYYNVARWSMERGVLIEFVPSRRGFFLHTRWWSEFVLYTSGFFLSLYYQSKGTVAPYWLLRLIVQAQ